MESIIKAQNFINNNPTILYFLIAVISLTTISLLLALIFGREKYWKKNLWNEENWIYASADEISNICETRSEKIFTLLPGIVLMMGLIATFFGIQNTLLGVERTLNNNENQVTQIAPKNVDVIENRVNDSEQNSDKKIKDIILVLDGLGFKFSTSIFSAAFYIILRYLQSLMGIEDKRRQFTQILFSAQKLNEENREREKSNELITHIIHASQVNSKGLKNIRDELSLILNECKEGNKNQLTIKSTLFEIHQKNEDKIKQLIMGVDIICKKLDVIEFHAKTTSDALDSFTKSTVNNISQMAKSSDMVSVAATEMASAAEKMNTAATTSSASATQMTEAISQFKHGTQKTFQDLSTTMNQAIFDLQKNISDKLNENGERLDGSMHKLNSAVIDLQDVLQTSIDRMVQDLKGAAEKIEEAGNGIKHGVKEFSQSSVTAFSSVVEVINSTIERQESLVDMFSETVENINEQIKMAAADTHDFNVTTRESLTSIAELALKIKNGVHKHDLITELGENITKAAKIFTLESKIIITEIKKLSGIIEDYLDSAHPFSDELKATIKCDSNDVSNKIDEISSLLGRFNQQLDALNYLSSIDKKLVVLNRIAHKSIRGSDANVIELHKDKNIPPINDYNI